MPSFSQNDSKQSPVLDGEAVPFTSEGVYYCPCNRSWMLPEFEIDSLKQEIWQFENKLRQELKDSLVDYSVTYTKVYWAEYIVRVEFDGQVNRQFCVNRDSSELQLNDSSVLNVTVESFGRKFLKRTSVHFYIGNATITTYHTEYFIIKE